MRTSAKAARPGSPFDPWDAAGVERGYLVAGPAGDGRDAPSGSGAPRRSSSATPADAYAAGEPGFYVVELDRAVAGPFAVEMLARNVRLALDGTRELELVELYDQQPEEEQWQ